MERGYYQTGITKNMGKDWAGLDGPTIMPQTAKAISKTQSTGKTSQSTIDYHKSDRGQFRDALWAEYQKDLRAITKLWQQGHVLADGTVFTEKMADAAIVVRYEEYQANMAKYAPPKKERGGTSRILVSGAAQAAIDAMLTARGVGVSIMDQVEESVEEVPEDGNGESESSK